MARVKVRLFANLRELARVKEIPLEGDDVHQVLKVLVERFPDLRSLVFQGEELQTYINILINGRSIHEFEGIKTPLSDGDEIALFPPISGG